MNTELMCGAHFTRQSVNQNLLNQMIHKNDLGWLSRLVEPRLGRLSKRILSAIQSGVTPIIFMENAEGDERVSEKIFNSEQRPVIALQQNGLRMRDLSDFNRLQIAMVEMAYVVGLSSGIKPRILVESGDKNDYPKFESSFSTAWCLVKYGQLDHDGLKARADVFQRLYLSIDETLHHRNKRFVDTVKRIPLSGDEYKVFGFIGAAHASMAFMDQPDLRIGFEDGSEEGYLSPLAAVSLLGLREGVKKLDPEYVDAMILAVDTAPVEEDDFSRSNKNMQVFYSKHGKINPVISRVVAAGLHKVRANW